MKVVKIIANISLLTSIIVSVNVHAADLRKTLDIKILSSTLDKDKKPSENFDLSYWKLNPPLPPREGSANTVLEIFEAELTAGYTHPQWFFTDPKTGAMVLRAPNKAQTTPNSPNARSELRGMLRHGNIQYGDHSKENNWVISGSPDAKSYASIGGTLSATLSVDWVSTSGDDTKRAAHAVIVGQIHGKTTEPIKIYYRKLPMHKYGSLFWIYDTWPTKTIKKTNVIHNLWGDYRLGPNDRDPISGIKLGEPFSYQIDVKGNLMNLTFIKGIDDNRQVITQSVDLSNGYTGHPTDAGYNDDWLYFKAGAYNQCNTKPTPGPACTNNGIEAGDYAQVSFYQLDVKYNK